MVGICENDVHASVLGLYKGITKPNLVVPRKQRVVVFDEAIMVVLHGIRRISKNQVSFAGRSNGLLKILAK